MRIVYIRYKASAKIDMPQVLGVYGRNEKSGGKRFDIGQVCHCSSDPRGLVVKVMKYAS